MSTFIHPKFGDWTTLHAAFAGRETPYIERSWIVGPESEPWLHSQYGCDYHVRSRALVMPGRGTVTFGYLFDSSPYPADSFPASRENGCGVSFKTVIEVPLSACAGEQELRALLAPAGIELVELPPLDALVGL